MDIQEMLAALQQQERGLERLAEEQAASAARFDADEQMRAAEAIEDPLERTKAIQDVLRLQSGVVSSQALNLAMRRHHRAGAVRDPSRRAFATCRAGLGR